MQSKLKETIKYVTLQICPKFIMEPSNS